MIRKTLFCLHLLFPVCLGYAFYQDRIPNSHNIPHPCIPNYRWPGVGHTNRNGGGETNTFGRDFARNGHQWTKSLCLQDSDGDGQTNGQELGDPDCTWSQGQNLVSPRNITHPGVCEPLVSPTCQLKNSFVSCSLDEFSKCDVIHNPDVESLDLRFPNFTIPSNITNYLCMTYDLPSDQDYHIVAHQPIINNSHVLHHMLLYGCQTGFLNKVSSTPGSCFMGTDSCFSIIGGWTVGHTGVCYGDTIGFKIGATGYIRVKLEIHYNNPNLVSDYTDTSGLRLYYRPVRPEVQDLVTLMTGQLNIRMHPGVKRQKIQGICQDYCTPLLFDRPVYVVQSLNHMHYLGRSMSIEVFRRKVSLINLTNDEHYSYDSPQTYIHNPPFMLLPGDEIITSCFYDTTSANNTVSYGMSTADEMCFGFLTIYPKDALIFPKTETACVADSSYTDCDSALECFINVTDPETVKMTYQLRNNCGLNEKCRYDCMEYIHNITIIPHECWFWKYRKYTYYHLNKSQEGRDILGRVSSCLNYDTETNAATISATLGILISAVMIIYVVLLDL